MKLFLTFEEQKIGEIYPCMVSPTTKELKGLLIPNERYFGLRASINKYFEIYRTHESANFIDRTLDKLLRWKYKDLSIIYGKIGIQQNNEFVMNSETRITIIDDLTKTGLGNAMIQIVFWGLDFTKIGEQFIVYEIDYPYPSNPSHILEVKKDNQVIFEY